jgi:hypothetical protein
MEGSLWKTTHEYPLTLIIYCDFIAAGYAIYDQNIYPKPPSNFKVRSGVVAIQRFRFGWSLARDCCRLLADRLVAAAPGGIEHRAGRRRARGVGGLTPGLSRG